MRPKHISATDFQGTTFAHTLSGINIWTGENRSGKTTRLNAIRLALLGYDLKLGKKAGELAKLASATTAAIALEFTDGSRNAIQVSTRGGKASIENNGSINPIILPSMALDPREFFNLTGPARTKLVFNALDIGEFDATEICDAIARIDLEPNDQEASDKIREVREEFESLDDDRSNQGESMPSFFAKVLEKWTATESGLRQLAKQFKGSIQTVTTLKAADAAPAIDEDVDQRLEAARTKHNLIGQDLREVQVKIRNVQGVINSAKHAAEKNGQVLRQRHEAKKALENWPDVRGELEAKEKEYGLKRQAYLALPTFDPNNGKSMVGRYKAQVELGETKINELRSDLKELPGKLQEKLESGCCPTCGGKTKGWQVKLQQEADKQKKELEQREAQWTEDLAKIKPLLEQAEKAEKENHDRYIARRDASNELESLVGPLKDLEGKVQKRNELLLQSQAADPAEIEVDIEAEEHKLRDLQAKGNELSTEEARFAGLIQELKRQSQQRQANLTDARRRQEAKENLEKAETDVKVWHAAIKIVREAQEAEIKKHVGKVMERASLFTRPVWGTTLTLVDGEIAYVRAKQGGYVYSEVFSGLEELLAFAGISLAFTPNARTKIVVMDELGRLSDGNKLKLIDTVARAIAEGQIDAFYGADVNGLAYKRGDVNLMHVGE